MQLVLSTDGGLSSGVSQSRCKSVYGTESHAPVNDVFTGAWLSEENII